jgi:hypothetical protein
MRALRIIFGVLCFGIGVAFAMGAVHTLLHPSYFDSAMDVAFPAMFGAMFLLGSYLLLRPSSPSSSNVAEMKKRLSELDSQVETLKVEAEMRAMLDE